MQQPAQQPQSNLKDYWGAMTMDEACELPPPEWMIKDWLPEHGTGVLYAKSGIGKSFLAADIAYAVLTGQSWHDKAVMQGSVLYVATEGAEGFVKRLRALRQRAGNPPEAQFRLVTRPVNLLDDKDVERFTAYANHVAAGGHPVRLVVIDTLNRCMPGVSDENSNAAMSQAVAGAEYIANNTGAFVLLVHHTDKRGNGTRGGYSLDCNTDIRLRMGERNTAALVPGRTVKLYNEKQRDAELEPPIPLRAEKVTLPDGSTSLVLVDGGKVRTPRKTARGQHDRVLRLHAKGVPAVEIAARLGMKDATVRSIISRKGSVATPATPKSRLHAV